MAKLKRRADGRFQKRVVVGKDGKRNIYKFVYGDTQKETERKAAELSAAFELADNVTFGEWSEQWIKNYKADKAYNTVKQYQRMLDAYILPVIGGVRLTDIKPVNVRNLVNGLSKQGIDATAGLALLTVRQILEAAMENELLEKNAAECVKPPKRTDKRTKTHLSDKERSLLLSKSTVFRANDKYGAFVFLLFFTGVRRGEALALTKPDIDLGAGKLKINKTVIFAPNAAVVKPSPKSAAGIREIEIARTLSDVLREYLPTVNGDIVFPDKNGEYMSLSAFRVFWKDCLNRFGLPNTVTPHRFRHNFATELFYANIDAKEAQRLMGHASMGLTMELYTHLRHDEAATKEKLDGIK